MNVNNFDKYICSYIDGDLRPSEVEKFEQLLKDNSECKQKFEAYKKMLSELSNLGALKTSNDFLDKLDRRINESKVVPLNKPKTIFGYDYITISGIAAAIGIFMFSISTFMTSESLPSFNLNKLSAKNVQEKLQNTNSSGNLIAEDDTSNENEEVDLPKIHLVGGKK